MENINLSRVLIDNDNPSICCNDDLCKKCKLCQKTCHNDMGVFGFYDLEKQVVMLFVLIVVNVFKHVLLMQ